MANSLLGFVWVKHYANCRQISSKIRINIRNIRLLKTSTYRDEYNPATMIKFSAA